LEVLGDKVIEVVIGLEDDVAAAAAVAAAGTAFGAIRFAEEGDTAFSAVSGAGVHFDFVDEHGNKKGRGSEPRPRDWVVG
jgi:hypothetical protein